MLGQQSAGDSKERAQYGDERRVVTDNRGREAQ
jgi:hypothetical protein